MTNISKLVADMVRFATLLRIVKLPGLADNYEAFALKLRDDPSAQTLGQVREFVGGSFAGTIGGVTDRYVSKGDGSVDVVLNNEYEQLLQELTDFANGS